RVLGHAFFEAGIDHLGRKDGVDADAPAAPFRAELARHLGHGAHGHAVGNVASPHGGNAGQGADVDDAALPGSQHAPARFLATTESAENQVPPGGFNVLQGDLLRSRPDRLTGDIAQEIDTSEVAVEFAEHRLYLFRFGNVARDGN